MTGDGNSSSGYTIKEMLDKIVIPTLESIDSRLDNKADRAAVEVLQARVGELERVIVRRDGPLAKTIEDASRHITVLESAMDERIRQEIRRERDQSFTRKDKMFLSVLGAIGALSSIIATIVLLRGGK